MKLIYAARRGYTAIAHWGFVEYCLTIVMIGTLWGGLAYPLYKRGWGAASLLAFPALIALASCLIWWLNRTTRPRTRSGIHGPIPLERQLSVLESCGISLRDKNNLDVLLSSWSQGALEADPYLSLLCAMGQEAGAGDGVSPAFCSDNIWHFDTECIEDVGDYSYIAKRMAALAGGKLPIENVSDVVDLEGGIASLSFSLDSKQHNWSLSVSDDWVDASIFSKFVTLLDGRSQDRHFTYLDLKGQDCLIGCLTHEQLHALRSQTKLDFTWLS